MAIQIHGFETGPVATYGYLVYDEETRDAVIIDAPPGSCTPITERAKQKGLSPGALILTHTHWDHTADAAAFKARYPEMMIYVHPDDEYRLTNAMEHTVWPLPFTIEDVAADRHLKHGDTFTLGAITFRALHTPGHTEGGICLYAEDEGVIFVGDTLFADSVGRIDLPGGSWEALERSIEEQLMTLPDTVRVFPGHGPQTTIGRERESNPFVKG